jgi:hypothetical protein
MLTLSLAAVRRDHLRNANGRVVFRHRVVALERLRLEDARELVRLQAAGAAAHAAGARLAAVLEAMLLGAAAQHRQQQAQQPLQQKGLTQPKTQPETPQEARTVMAAAPWPEGPVAGSSGQRLAGRLPDPAGRLVLLQLREALDV